MTTADDFKARLAEGSKIAPSLVGLTRDDAVARVEAHGFDVQVIPATAEGISADLRVNRIRIFLDEEDTVIRAWAG